MAIRKISEVDALKLEIKELERQKNNWILAFRASKAFESFVTSRFHFGLSNHVVEGITIDKADFESLKAEAKRIRGKITVKP